MAKYISKRLLSALPTLLGVFIAIFFIIRLIPGDPAEVMLGANATNAQIDLYRRLHGLDQNIFVQLGLALKSLFIGDLGRSLSHSKPVLDVVLEALPNTIELALIGIAISSALAVVLGVIAACFRGRWPDLAVNIGTTIGMALPTFYIGLWVLFIFASKLNWIPVISTTARVPHWKTLFGPVLTMILGSSLARTTRSSMLEILEEDFIRTARAKGVSGKKVLFRHALGNALIPIVTMVGYGLATSFGGAIVLETVFVRNGIGKVLIDAITIRDYPLIQGTTLVIAIFMIAANLLTDIAVGFVDPRIRVSDAA